MTDPGLQHHVEIKEGDDTVAAADVTAPAESEGTAQASLHSSPGHVTPGRRARLVDAVMDLPEVEELSRLEAGSRWATVRRWGACASAARSNQPARGIECAGRRRHPGPASGDVPAPPAGDVPSAALGGVPPAPPVTPRHPRRNDPRGGWFGRLWQLWYTSAVE